MLRQNRRVARQRRGPYRFWHPRVFALGRWGGEAQTRLDESDVPMRESQQRSTVIQQLRHLKKCNALNISLFEDSNRELTEVDVCDDVARDPFREILCEFGASYEAVLCQTRQLMESQRK